MLLVIDAGNTQTVFGVWTGGWRTIARIETDVSMSSQDIEELVRDRGIRGPFERVLCASVVPGLNNALSEFSRRYLQKEIVFLTAATIPHLEIQYEPPEAVGADRLANAIALRAKHTVPGIVVDFGTATTLDVVGSNGEYMGGSIMTGPLVSMDALFARASKLHRIELKHPRAAIGRTTEESLLSGLMLGYAGAVDVLCKKIKLEMGTHAFVVSTGGLASLFAPICEEVQLVDDTLTLDGIRFAFKGEQFA